jgi:hypothetical protein
MSVEICRALEVGSAVALSEFKEERITTSSTALYRGLHCHRDSSFRYLLDKGYYETVMKNDTPSPVIINTLTTLRFPPSTSPLHSKGTTRQYCGDILEVR